MKAMQEILNIFEQNKGFLCSSEISNHQRYYLDKLLQKKDVSRIRKGIYVLKNHELYDERVLISKIIPKGVFCLFTAWDFYQLTTSIPSKHYIALGRNIKIKEIEYPTTQIYYWKDNFYNLGVVEVNIDDNAIKIYDLEKSVCDAIKFRAKIGDEIVIEVLRNYIKRKDKNLDRLMKYAKTLLIKKAVEQYIKPLL